MYKWGMKKCNKCEEVKDLNEFFKDKNNKTDGRYSICKTCKQNGTFSWREKNRERYNELHRIYNKKNYDRLRIQRYKLTVEQHLEMYKNQNGLCAICENPPKGKRPLCIDHNHKTGKVRGLLCYACNRALSILETEVLLAKSLEYLRLHK